MYDALRAELGRASAYEHWLRRKCLAKDAELTRIRAELAAADDLAAYFRMQYYRVRTANENL
jgi:hypothetical protein